MKITARGLYLILFISCFIGIIIPMVTIVLKASAEDFTLWKKAKIELPWAANLVQRIPAADLENYPALSEMTWHRAHRPRVFKTYARSGVAALFLLVSIIFFRKKIYKQLQLAEEWANNKEHLHARRLIVTICFGLFFVFVTKLGIGFFIPGISGWTYENRVSKMLSHIPDNVPVFSDIPDEFRAALNPDASIGGLGNGFLRGRVQFFHFQNGQILPFNDGLTGYVFPDVVFVTELIPHGSPQAYLYALKHGLDAARKQHGFLLPEPFSYPRHTVYMPIDYRTYPSADQLVKITDWTMYIKIDQSKGIDLVSLVNNHELYVE